MALNLTHGSAMAYETILYGNMTPKMAAEYLRNEKISVPDFLETLQQMYPGKDLQRRLRQFYRKVLSDKKQRSVDRNIQNWLSGRNHPSDREDYFRIAFALGLTEAQLNYLLGVYTDYAIQYRDGREAVLAWFLRNGSEYADALIFLQELKDIEKNSGRIEKSNIFSDYAGTPSPDSGSAVSVFSPSACGSPDPSKVNENSGQSPRINAAPLLCTASLAEISGITQEIRNEFMQARITDDLRICYLHNLNRFGRMHIRGYYYFCQYLNRLIQPRPVAGKNELDYSIETVMDTYLTLKMPAGKKRTSYSLVQKLIKRNWPNTTFIRKILSHKEDVPRKLLLLLYVVTENSGFMDDYSEFDEDYISLEERVEDHWWTLNAMLTDCGMAPMDLRNAFDWLILYSVSTNGEESMSVRLEGVIDELFRDVSRKAQAI